MLADQVTVVVVPRQRFSYSARCLESIYAGTPPPFDLVCVDGGSPEPVKTYLEAQVGRPGFRLIRTSHFLSPNQARNLGLAHVRTRYVAIVENDTVVQADWLGALMRCAEETEAAVVGPLYLIGRPGSQLVHMAAGNGHIEERDGKRCLHEQMRFLDTPVSKIAHLLRREECEMVEAHCWLIDMTWLGRMGGFDEGILSCGEHIDFCLAVRHLGGRIFFEPQAVVTHSALDDIQDYDLPYYLLRWSAQWNRASLRHLRDKWRLSPDDPYLPAKFSQANARRKRVLMNEQLLSPEDNWQT